MSHERDERSREEPAAPAGAREARCGGADGPERKRVAETRIRLRRMQLSHIDSLMPYEREMFGTEAWSRSSYRDELLDTRNRYYVAAETEAGELVGWGGVLVVQDAAEILTVGVVPAAKAAMTSGWPGDQA